MAKSPNTDSALFRIGYFYGLGKEARLVAFFFVVILGLFRNWLLVMQENYGPR